MIFKINARVNLLIKIVVFLKFIVLLVYAIAVIRNIPALRDNYYLATADEVLYVLILLYIISVLRFLGEKEFVRAFFFTYLVVELVISAFGVIVSHIPHPLLFSLMIAFGLAVLIVLASLSVFIASLSIQSTLIFKPILLYTTTLAVFTILEFPVIGILVLFEGNDAKGIKIAAVENGIHNFNLVLIGMMMIVVIWLANRVNRYVRDIQTFDA